jgi:hypothetical protein
MQGRGWAGLAAVVPVRRQAGRPAGRSRQQKEGRRPFAVAAVVERWEDSQDTDYSAAGAGRRGADTLLDRRRRRQADSYCHPADTRRRGSRRHTVRDTRRWEGSGYPAAVHSRRRRSRDAAGATHSRRRRDIGGSRWEGRGAWGSSGRGEGGVRPRSDWRPPWWPGRSGSGAAATANTERKIRFA